MPAEKALLEADIRAREEAVDVTRSFIVQAPAGSGKTELLIQRYLSLLAIVDNPEEVLAITFTRKAAREMQQRVSVALRQARAGVVAGSAHEQTTLDAAAAVLEREADLDWRLIESPRRMRIQTLDALCAGIAGLLPLSSGIGGISNTIADAEVRAIYRAAAVATLDWLPGDDDLSAAVENVLGHLDNNTGLYIRHIARMLETRDQWLDITGSGQVDDSSAVRLRLESNIADIVRNHLSATRASLDPDRASELTALARYAASMLCAAGESTHPVASLADLPSIPAANADDLPLWRGLRELLLTRNGSWRRKLTRREGFPPGDQGQKQACLELIANLSTHLPLLDLLQGVRLLPEPEYDDQQWSVLLALLTLLPLAVTELKRIFSEQGVVDYVEVAQAAEAALGRPDEPGDIALMLDYAIRHLLLDEMQDTSISQYRLLQSLTAGWETGDGRTLFCVGDPMQSIYRFRNAEVGQFVRAREQGVSGLPLESLTLRQNFRSGEHLVHWFNNVFEQILPQQDDIASGAVSYSESVSVPGLSALGEHTVHALFDTSAAAEASIAADVIESCLATPSESDVAVLVRSRSQLTQVLAELRHKSIDYHAVEIDRLTDLPEIINLLALTRAFCHWGDRTAWLGLLRSPLLGLTWSDLHQLVHGAPGESVWDLIQDETRVSGLTMEAQSLLAKFVPTVQRCFATDRVQSLRLRIECAWYQLGGPAGVQEREHLDNIYRFFDVLDKIETAGTLADPAELEQRLDDERVSSHATEHCRVQVMTIHRAKGLEFDHVVLPSLGRATSGRTRTVLNWLNIPGDASGSRMIISPVGPAGEIENDRLHQYIGARLQNSDRMELDRLLYVACTRARKSLHLIGHVNTSDDGGGMRAPHSGSLLLRLWPALEAAFARAFEQGKQVADRIEKPQKYAVPILRRARWAMPAPPPLPVAPGAGPDSTEVAERPVEFYWVGSAARHAGTIVHRWLHKFAGQPPSVTQLDPMEPLTRRWAQELRVSGDDIALVCERVSLALARVLEDSQGRWVLSGAGHAELALTGLWQNKLEAIVVDRVRIDEQGVHWIIDYKTSTHEGGDLAEFLRHETDRYRQQLQKYTHIYRHYADVPVKAALYFPLLQQFVEIDVSD